MELEVIFNEWKGEVGINKPQFKLNLIDLRIGYGMVVNLVE